MRRWLALLLLAAGPLLLFLRRRVAGHERVSLYYDDGSMVTLESGSSGAGRLIALARAAL